MPAGQQVLQLWRALSAAQQEELSCKAIASLPPSWREVLLLVEREGQSLDSVAVGLKQDVAFVESTLLKTREWVYGYLQIALLGRSGSTGSNGGGGTPAPAVLILTKPKQDVNNRKPWRAPIYEAEKGKV